MPDQEAEIASLRRQLESERRRAEEERQRGDKAAQERDRAAQERDRAAQERDRAAQERDRAAQERDRAAQERDRAAQEHRDAVASVAFFKRRNEELERERRLEQERQTFRPYLWQVSCLQQHLSRVIPLPAPATDSKAPGSTKTSTTKSATFGQTSIAGKYYPLQVRPWSNFSDQIGDVFSQLDGQLGDRQVFPPSLHVQADEISLLDALPAQFLNTEYFHSEGRTSMFIGAALERPSSKLLAEYFAARGHAKAVFFDNQTAGVRTVSLSASQNTESTSVSGDTTDMEPVADSGVDEPTAASESSPSTTRKRATRKTLPDCIVLSVDLNSGGSDDASRRRVVIGEHKPCHALRAPELAALPALANDCLVRLAVASNRRKEQKLQKELGKKLQGQSGSPIPTRGRGGSVAPSRSTTKQVGPSGMSPLQVYFASALAQTYHYMLLSGLAYGYLASGETLTFLHIPESEATTLLYHTAFFPGVAPHDLPQKDGQPVYPSSVTAPSSIAGMAPVGDAAWAAAAHTLAIVQLCGLCLLAFASPIRGVNWTSNAATQLASFPSLPLGLRRRYSSSVSPAGVRRRDDQDPDTDDDDRSDGADDNTERGRGRPGRVARLRSDQGRAPSPLRQIEMATERAHNTPTTDKTCAYCTQACLLGLARGLALNAACPNYALHKAALADTRAEAGTVKNTLMECHPITPAELRRLLCQQLRRSVMENCWCLYDEGARGAIGCLFKIRLSGYGYTFVAKGVEQVHACKLRRESRIYRALQAQQGVLMPVHLGLVKLLAPYPLMQRFAALTHFMLLSHAGVVLHHGPQLAALSKQLGRDLEDEIANTYDKLLDWGVQDFDEEVYNATWCEEVQGVMKIDFDHARLNKDVYEQQKARYTATVLLNAKPGMDTINRESRKRKRNNVD